MKDRQIFNLGDHKRQVDQRLAAWKTQQFLRRLWEKDYTLWFSKPVPEISDRLGWLILPEVMREKLEEFVSFSEEVKAEGITHVVLLGMGGSSLAPEVFQKTFGNSPGYPELIVLDSTHPGAVQSVEDRLDLHRTLFLVSSKSGTTLETLSFFRYFWDKVCHRGNRPQRHFVAISDSGSPLVKLAQERHFRRIFNPLSDVGGRYSAFTDFGLVPAALIGMDAHMLLDVGWTASENCAFCVSEEKSSGLSLGAALGELAKDRDKLTIRTSSSIKSFPIWLEQLIAESTGKKGKGILPVADEPIVPVDVYGNDRSFVFILVEGDESRGLESYIKEIKASGHPSICINLKETSDLGQEIFRWEIAVAAAGSILGIHPFNQPDVQLAKDLARQAMEREKGMIEKESSPDDAVSIKDMDALAAAVEDWISSVQPGDYVGLQAYLAPSFEVTESLQKIRLDLLQRTRLATTIGYGPRFLHSTGQFHKGGPNKGLFLQLIDEPQKDLPVPETDYSFASLIQAQSFGDYRALKQRKRRILRINLKDDASEGLKKLEEIIRSKRG